MRYVLIAAVAAVLADQSSKYFVVEMLDLKTLGRIDVIDPLLNFRMAWNHGVNFGLFAHDSQISRWMLILIATGISGFVVWWIKREDAGFSQQIAAGLLVGGALGNVIDRLHHGAVADFINMSCCGFANPYSFNVADVFVFAGVAGILVFGREKKVL
ncbi:MAG: signal peptidase II [Roseovarius sp.]|nr:signal peptidase II [Roseovarius sp.]MCY4209232.1 signal peptidase II [Roseovarius sp.]MCY4292071.1 signal peptidase II [Roseovarius sp.]MCY4316870.1 signal peptidase II [Roseovarius sp.]